MSHMAQTGHRGFQRADDFAGAIVAAVHDKDLASTRRVLRQIGERAGDRGLLIEGANEDAEFGGIHQTGEHP